MVLTQIMKNNERTTGIRNRPLRGQGWSFQLIEAPRGRPFGAAQGIAIAGLAFPEITGIVQFSGKILRFQQIANHL